MYPLATTWHEYAVEVRETLFDMLGTDKPSFYADFIVGAATVTPDEVLDQVNLDSKLEKNI